MHWEPVQTSARDKGNLVFAMDQGQTAVMTQPGPWGVARSGYCMGMAVRWIALQYAGKNFPFNRGSRTFTDVDWQSTAAQNRYWNHDWVDEADHWIKAAEAVGLRVSNGLRTERQGKPTADRILEVMRQAYGCYGISLNRERGGHAIAARHGRDNRFHLFDPNYGHFVADRVGGFRKFVDWYLAETGYGERYTASIFVCGVKPPIGPHGPNNV